MRRLLLLAAAAVASPLAAQNFTTRTSPASQAGAAAAAARAARAAQPPVLDGRTDDPAWSQASAIDQFLEYEPNEGAVPRFRTEVRVAYDDRNLYVLARMHDPAPDSVVSLLSRRDVRTASDQLKIVIDSYHDRRTAYQFAVNPAGVKRDYYVYNDNNEDDSWDAVWDVATRIDSLGWVAEFRIPLSQLRFANKPEHTFGFMVVRDVARTGQRISWPLFRRNVQGYVSQAGEIGGIRDLPSPRRLEIAPYVVTKNVTVPDGAGYVHRQEATGGADLKYGLSTNLTLDATINPDFGQVEADPAVLNLSSFETFFQERRPFFLEGTGIFDFRVNCGDIDSGCTGLFYSRRIGRGPQLRDDYGDDRSSSATTILGAAKLTGRLSTGTSVGLINAVTQREVGTLDRTIEPQTNYLVARLQQDLNNGQSGFGVMLTSVDRQLDNLTSPVLRRGAHAAGVDFRHRFLNRNYELFATFAGSIVSGSREAIAATQTDGVHAYQRPDDDVAYDPTRTSLLGDMQRVTVSKFGGGITRFQTLYQRYSPGFEINDAGFLSRADQQEFRNWFAVQLQKPRLFYRMAFFNFNHWSEWTAGGLPTNIGFNQNSHVQFKNQWWMHLGFNYGNFLGTTWNDRSARGGPAIRRDPNFSMWGGIEADSRKPVVPGLWFGAFRADGGRSSGGWLDPQVQLRIASRVSATVGASYNRNIDDWQWLGNFGDLGTDTTHYTFAHLNQTTLSLTTRLNVTATPTLSVQLYAQPFVTTGEYTDWRELSAPRAEGYADRFRPYAAGGDPGGFNYKQFQSNAVVRWEYRPGSTLFFVWSQGRSRFLPEASRFDFGGDYGNLFSLHPDNTFLVKASYWFNP